MKLYGHDHEHTTEGGVETLTVEVRDEENPTARYYVSFTDVDGTEHISVSPEIDELREKLIETAATYLQS